MNWEGAGTQDVLKRYPRLTAHLICESLGYFTPRSAANAILHHKRRELFWCEWYYDIAGKRLAARGAKLTYDQVEVRNELLAVGQDVLKWAIQSRRRHQGYMADYGMARRVIADELAGHGPEFASWF